MKNLLAGEQQAAVTVAVESLMDNKPETEATFATLDPKVTSHYRSIPHSMHSQASCAVKVYTVQECECFDSLLDVQNPIGKYYMRGRLGPSWRGPTETTMNCSPTAG